MQLLAQENDTRLFLLGTPAGRVTEPGSGDRCSEWVVRNQDTSGTCCSVCSPEHEVAAQLEGDADVDVPTGPDASVPGGQGRGAVAGTWPWRAWQFSR